MQTYEQRAKKLESELADVRGALGRDVAAAIFTKIWRKDIRDKYDIEALVARIDELARDAGFMETIHASADRARDARGRGRPRKPVAAAKPAKTNTHDEGEPQQ